MAPEVIVSFPKLIVTFSSVIVSFSNHLTKLIKKTNSP